MVTLVYTVHTDTDDKQWLTPPTSRLGIADLIQYLFILAECTNGFQTPYIKVWDVHPGMRRDNLSSSEQGLYQMLTDI